MKKIIPFVKELNFKTKVSEITSISLEHNITLKESDLISGVFHINGDYKMTEGSINREKFSFNLPFDIALDSRYNTEESTIDIDNFYYEIISNDILKVHIDLYIEGEMLKEEPKEEEKEEIEVKEEPKVENRHDEEPKIAKQTKEDPLISKNEPIEQSIIYDKKNINDIEPERDENEITINNTNINENNNIGLFDNLDGKENYATYHVYIVKEDDTIDKIMTKYNVTKEDLENYNDISNINIGDKLVIPSTNGN